MTGLAYLVIREGSKWTDVFRLIPGRTVTVGRAPTNQIVIKDERCSRYHAEIFMTDGAWTIRDLDSRNGTAIGEDRIDGDTQLESGNIIRIENSQMAFVHDLSEAFPDSSAILRAQQSLAEETVVGEQFDDESVLDETFEPTTITHRRIRSKFLRPPEEDDEEHVPNKIDQAATKLCRLGFELANQADVNSIANLALNALFESTQVDSGALLLVPRDFPTTPSGGDLEVVASRTDDEPNYHRVSRFLATTVLREGEAVLARNVEGDSTLGSRDSKGVIHATSVICAPIRHEGQLVGLIHIYSTDPDRVTGPDDLEFTLTVADIVGQALKTLGKQQELTENLTQRQDEIQQLRKRLGAESNIIGSSPLMDRVQQEILRASPTRATVLIRGESGVGKELVARAVHYASPRQKGPFVCLNCAALTESLLESELFGHERGAFTGATERKIGKFEASDMGTIMLDEIGEMPLSVQAKFLRVLEGHPFERVGGAQPIKVDVRVIAATNRDLEKAVTEGIFRRDLYFRLRVVEVVIPPLRKRPEDVIELAEHFLARFNAETGRKIVQFTPSAINHLRSYRWPGNVRELKNVIERAVVLARSDFLDVEDLTLSNLETAGDTSQFAPVEREFQPLSLADIEKQHIQATLDETGWNKSRAAGILGIERSTLDRKIRRYELAPNAPSGR